MAKKDVLGRGLSALIPDIGPAAVTDVRLSSIIPNPYQPRDTFDEEALSELAASIRALGIIQPLTLRRSADGKYQIISGERRFRAAGMAGLETVPAYIRQADDTAMLEMAIVENIQRENLDAIETALSFQRLMDECNLTQEEMAERVGKKRATIANFLRLLKLPEEIQKELKLGRISVGHAKAILSVEDPEMQIGLCRQAVESGWSVRQLEGKVSSGQLKMKSTVKAVELPGLYSSLGEEFEKHFGSKASLKRSSNGDVTLTVRFKDDSQASIFLDTLKAL